MPIERNHLAGSRSRLLAFSAHSYDINRSDRLTAHYTCIQHLLSVFVSHSDKRCLVSKSFFTNPSKCYSSPFSITWPFLSAPAQFHLSLVAHSSRIHTRTSRILAQYGISFGAVLPPFSRVRGWLFIQICRVLRRGRRRIVFKDGYGTHFSRSPNIAFRCSYVLC